MGTISIKVHDRTYRLSCGDGEEERLKILAEYVRCKADELRDEFGRIGQEHMLLMSAILIADELFDEREKKGAGAGAADLKSPVPARGSPDQAA